jgi:two-component system response regulator
VSSEQLSILIADDNKEDRYLMLQAFADAKVSDTVEFVQDGEELMETLRAQPAGSSLPGLILLDLNMPRLDGRATLKAIRADPRFAPLPVLILTTSSFGEEILSCYRLGANAVMVKPMGYEELVELAATLKRFWLDQVQLPARFLGSSQPDPGGT